MQNRDCATECVPDLGHIRNCFGFKYLSVLNWSCLVQLRQPRGPECRFCIFWEYLIGLNTSDKLRKPYASIWILSNYVLYMWSFALDTQTFTMIKTKLSVIITSHYFLFSRLFCPKPHTKWCISRSYNKQPNITFTFPVSQMNAQITEVTSCVSHGYSFHSSEAEREQYGLRVSPFSPTWELTGGECKRDTLNMHVTATTKKFKALINK